MTDDKGFTIRKATVDDAQGIAHVHVTGWQETYGPLLPEGALDGLDVGERASRWAELIADGITALVAENGTGIVAWATVGEGRDEDPPVAREPEGIYSLARVHGSGVVQQLLEAAIGDGPTYLWIMDGNERAEAFYRRNGFRRDGVERDDDLAGHPVTTVRMVRRS